MTRKIALVGIGKIAETEHVPAIAASDDWELACTVSRHGSVAGVEAFTDLADMLAARPDVGVVSFCLPPVPRYQAAQLALAVGRHVMLEKPPGATLAECFALKAQAEQMGVTLYASWHSRAAAQVQAAKAFLADKALKSLVITWKEDVREWHPGQQWIWAAGGLGVFDPGINAFSILTEILPDPLHITSADLHFPQNRETPIAAELEFHHPGGAKVTAALDWAHTGPAHWNIEAETDGGTLRLAQGGAQLFLNGAEQPSPAAASGPLGREYPRLYRHMAELVAAGKSDTDFSPLVHVADAFLLGRRHAAAPFHDTKSE